MTDAGLDSLASLKNLTKLYLWQTKCTDAGVAKLKENVPDVVVSLPPAEVAEAAK